MNRSVMSICIVLGLIPLCVLTYNLIGTIPFWDSAVYASCIMELGYQSPLFPLARCGLGDPIVTYVTPLWIAYVISGGMVSALYGGHLFLLLIYLSSLFVIIRNSILKKSATFFDYLFPVALFGYDPLIMAYTFVISPDFGITVFSTAYVAAILSGHFFLAAALGMVMLLSKATALSLFGLLGSASLFYVSCQGVKTLKGKLKFFVSRFVLTMLVPLSAYWCSVYVLRIFPISFSSEHLRNTCWSRPNSIFELLFTFDFSSPTATNYLFNIFGLNFHWLETLLLITCIAIGLCRRVVGSRFPREDRGATTSYLAIALLFVVITVYTTTRCQHYNNPRYILVTVPFFHLAFLFSIYFAELPRYMRNFVFLSLISLQVVSSVSTTDPVSKWFYGTFSFGDRSLLSMTSRSFECCGYGRDQLSYNVQHLFIDEITADILKETNASPDSPIVIDGLATFYLLGGETPQHERCLSRRQLNCTKETPLLAATSVVTKRPQSFTYIDFPFVPKRLAFKDHLKDYTLEATRRFTSGPYFIDTYRYRLQETKSSS